VFTQLLKNNVGKTKLIKKSKKEEINEWLSPGEENAGKYINYLNKI